MTTNLKDAREKAGLTQDEASRLVGVTQRTYVRWENNERKMSVEKFFRALKALQEAQDGN